MSVSLRERVDVLIGQVEQGKILEAFEEFYAEDVVMRENSATPTVGKAANRGRERAFVASVAEVHECRAKARLVDGEQAVIEWVLEFTDKSGKRVRLEQTALQTWRGGRIAHERFFYDPAASQRN
jgi:ketosteroid isomerase-like protein